MKQTKMKKRRRHGLLSCLFLFFLIIVLGNILCRLYSSFSRDDTVSPVLSLLKNSSGKNQIDPSILAKDLPVSREAALQILHKKAGSDADYQEICKNEAAYPERILQLLAINSEMKQFVLDYPKNIRTVYDGNFSVSVSQKQVPLFLQFDERWGYADYGNSIIAIAGCGPTCLSMAYTYLTQDTHFNPIKAADYSVQHGYLDADTNTRWALMKEGAQNLGLTSKELPLDKSSMIQALKNKSVIIASMKPGDFTKNGHFIVIRSYQKDAFQVNDPNSKARSNVNWSFDRLSGQIANLWALSTP